MRMKNKFLILFMSTYPLFSQEFSVCDQLKSTMTQRETTRFEEIVRTVSKPHRHEFINVCAKLIPPHLNGYSKLLRVEALFDVSPLHYQSLINAVLALTASLEQENQTRILQGICRVDPLFYEEFVQTYMLLTQNIPNIQKSYLAQVLGKTSPACFPFLRNFIQNNEFYFTYVPPCSLSLKIQNPMPEGDLKTILDDLYQQYRHSDHAVCMPAGLAFDIHHFAGNFNKKAIMLIQKHMACKKGVSYVDAVCILNDVFLKLVQQTMDRKSHLEKDFFDTVVDNLSSPFDQETLALIVSYLKTRPENDLMLWLDAFLEESKNAYDGSDRGTSCLVGIRERAVTSLRNIQHHFAELNELIQEAEYQKIQSIKLRSIGTISFIAQTLKRSGHTILCRESLTPMKKEDLQHCYFSFLYTTYFNPDDFGREDLQDVLAGVQSRFKEDDFWDNLFMEFQLCKKE